MKKNNDLSKYDVSERSRQSLEYALSEEKVKAREKKEGPRVPVKEALKAPSQYEISSDRETTRLLFISQDASLLNQTTQSLDGYLNLSDVFDEVHIVVLQAGIRTRNPVLRVAPNVWLYIASAKHLFQTPFEAYKIITKQLMFADGFRADLVVARDPFESALVAYYIGKSFSRPTQIHILNDYFNSKIRLQERISLFKYFIAKILIKRFLSIRTKTDSVAKKVREMFPDISDVETLPRFRNTKILADAKAYFDVKEKYQQFSFIILYIGSLNRDSKVYQAIDVARTQMRNKKIGLVIVGVGDSIAEFKKRTELLGVASQVVFEKNTDDLISYLKTADVLLVPDTTEDSDEIVLTAAAVGIPIIMSKTPTRDDLFQNGMSALLFNPDDIPTFTNHLSHLLSEPNVRNDLVAVAKEIVFKRLNDDPLEYQLSYRDSVEQAMFTKDATSALPSVVAEK